MKSTWLKSKGHVQVVVAELAVLLRVEHLQQRAGGVAAEVAPQLVDLVEHEDRVLRLDAAQALDDAPRHRTDIGAAETADVRFIADAAQRQPHELAVHGAGDADAQAGLAHARRPHEAEHDALALAPNLVADVLGLAAPMRLALGAQLAHRQELQDALLDLVQAVVILVQHPPRIGDVQVVGRLVLPRQAYQQIQVRLDHAVFGGLDRHAFHAVQFAARFFLRLFGHARLADALIQFADVGFVLVFLAQFLLDRLHLLAQEELPLHPLHFALGFRLDLPPQFQDFDLLLEQPGEPQQLVAHAVHLQDRLGVGEAQAHAAGDEIGELAAVVHVYGHDRQLVGHLRFQLDQLAEELLHGAHQRLHLDAILHSFGDDLDAGAQVRFFLRVLQNADALQPLHQEAHRAVRRLEDAMHLRRSAHRVNLVRRRLLGAIVAAGDQGDDAVVGQRLLHQADAALLADGQRQPHHRVDDDAAQRQHGQVIGDQRIGQLPLQFCTLHLKFLGLIDHFVVFVVPVFHFKIVVFVIHAVRSLTGVWRRGFTLWIVAAHVSVACQHDILAQDSDSACRRA
jgi:hypothetical protein